MNIQEVINHEAVSIEPRALLVEAARKMVDNDIGFLPVIENGILTGVVTDRDIVARGVAAACNLSQAVVADVMSREVVCCFANQDTDEVKGLMAKHGVSRLPVIDDSRAVIGIVSTSNIDGHVAPRKKSVLVTFQKEKTDAYGRAHKVPVKTVYITGKPTKEEAVEAAVHHFENEQKTSWDKAANSIDVVEGPERPGEKGERPS